MSGLQIERLTKDFGATRALDDVSLEVAKGEFMTILGPSGSGKTTILRTIAGVERPTTGDVKVAGQSILNVPIQRRNVGMVFQGYALFPHMSVLDNVVYPLKMRSVRPAAAHQRAREMLDIVGLAAYEDRRPDALSGGQQQRVALARALVFEPEVLVLDEPLAALDRRMREQMQFELRRIHDACGATTLCVTHDQAEALSMSDRIAILRDGHLEQVGTPQEVYVTSSTRFVAQFLGDANVFRCGVEPTTNGRAELTNGPRSWEMRLPSELSTAREVDVITRVENVRLRPTAGPTPWTGIVQQAAYLGDATRYVIRVGEMDVVAKVPRDAAVFVADDRVDVDLQTDNSFVFAVEAKAGAAK